MIDPAELRAAQVTALREIPEVVTLLGADADNIVDYVEEENGDLFNTIWGLAPPKLLVVYQGTAPSGGSQSMWLHSFSWVIRVAGSPTALFTAIVNGIRTGGSGLPFIHDSISDVYHPMGIPTMRRSVIPVSDTASKDYWEILTSYTSRGVE